MISCPPSLSESRLFIGNFRFGLHLDPFQYDLKKNLACMGDKSRGGSRNVGKGGPVRGQSPELLSVEGASADGGPPQKILKN